MPATPVGVGLTRPPLFVNIVVLHGRSSIFGNLIPRLSITKQKELPNSSNFYRNFRIRYNCVMNTLLPAIRKIIKGEQ